MKKFRETFKLYEIVYKKSCIDEKDSSTYYFMYIAEIKDKNYYKCMS